MSKRFSDTLIWERQHWFRMLDPHDKLVWFYVKDICDHAGIWPIDLLKLKEDTGLNDFDFNRFIENINKDIDPFTGQAIARERLIVVKNKYLFITGFVQFQYQGKDLKVNPRIPAVRSALMILSNLDLLQFCIDKGYITLTEPFYNSFKRVNEMDRNSKTKNIAEPDKNKNGKLIISLKSKIVIDFLNGKSEEFKMAFLEYWEMRKRIKKPIETERTLNGIINKLSELSGNNESLMIKLLHQSTDNRWQGIFPLNNKGGSNGWKQSSRINDRQYPIDQVF